MYYTRIWKQRNFLFYLFIYLFFESQVDFLLCGWSHCENKETETPFIMRYLQVILEFEFGSHSCTQSLVLCRSSA
jgi:hypothetical protein